MELEGHGILPKMCLERTILSESRTSKWSTTCASEKLEISKRNDLQIEGSNHIAALIPPWPESPSLSASAVVVRRSSRIVSLCAEQAQGWEENCIEQKQLRLLPLQIPTKGRQVSESAALFHQCVKVHQCVKQVRRIACACSATVAARARATGKV